MDDHRSCDNRHGKVNVFRTDGHEDGVVATDEDGNVDRDGSGYHGDHREERERIAANRRLKRKSKGEKKRRGVNEELRYMGWTERERKKKKRDPWRTKEKLRSKGCKAREWRIPGEKGDRTQEKINEKIRLGVDKKKDWKKKRGRKQQESARQLRDDSKAGL